MEEKEAFWNEGCAPDGRVVSEIRSRYMYIYILKGESDE